MVMRYPDEDRPESMVRSMYTDPAYQLGAASMRGPSIQQYADPRYLAAQGLGPVPFEERSLQPPVSQFSMGPDANLSMMRMAPETMRGPGIQMPAFSPPSLSMRGMPKFGARGSIWDQFLKGVESGPLFQGARTIQDITRHPTLEANPMFGTSRWDQYDSPLRLTNYLPPSLQNAMLEARDKNWGFLPFALDRIMGTRTGIPPRQYPAQINATNMPIGPLP